MGKSYSSTEVKDNRVAVESDSLLYMTSPESQLTNAPGSIAAGQQVSGVKMSYANPFGVSMTESHNSNVSYGNIVINDLDGVNALVTEIMTQAQEHVQTVADTTQELGTDILESIGQFKEPLLKYLPFVGIGVIVLLIFMLRKR